MAWLTLIIVMMVAVALGAVLLRHPGVMLYDWIASRKVRARAQAVIPALKAHPQAASAEHAEPAALAG